MKIHKQMCDAKILYGLQQYNLHYYINRIILLCIIAHARKAISNFGSRSRCTGCGDTIKCMVSRRIHNRKMSPRVVIESVCCGPGETGAHTCEASALQK